MGIFLAFTIPMISRDLGGGDFIAYWSSAHLLISGGDPYDQYQMTELEIHTQPGRFNNENVLLNAWNPPWLIISLIPLGFLPFEIALRMWIFISTLLIAISIRYSWKLIDNNFSERDFLLTTLIGFTFGPTLSLFGLGQISGLLLISMVLIIYLLKINKDLLAGALSVFMLSKPHISYLVVIYLLIFIVTNNRWKFLWGLFGSILLSSIVMWILLPEWIESYYSLISSLPYSSVYTSTVGSLISDIFDINYFNAIGVLLLPIILYSCQRLSRGDLLTAVNIGFLISLPLSFFGFLFDQVVLIPSLIQIYKFGIKDQSNNYIKGIVIFGYLLIFLFTLLLLVRENIKYYWFFWIPVSILSLFLFAWKNNYAKK